MKICSLTITTSTKEAIIGDHLKSLEPHVDACLVHHLIDGNADRTIDAAIDAAGDKLRTKNVWSIESFAGWRNDALAWAGYLGFDWAIFLDTDERLLANGQNIRAMLADQPLTRKVLDVAMDTGAISKPVFFRLPTPFTYKHDVHEELDNPDPYVVPVIRYHELPKTEEQKRKRLAADLQGLDKQIAAEPKNFRWQFYKAQTLTMLHEDEQARGIYMGSAPLAPSPALVAWALYGAAKCALRLTYYETALYDALEGLSFCPSMAELHLLAGNACYALGRMEDAKAWAYSATLHGRTVRGVGLRRNGTNDPIALFDGPLTLLAEIGHALGNKADERQFRHEAEIAAISRKNFCERGVE